MTMGCRCRRISIYAEYARTGASAALLARSFTADVGGDLTQEVARVYERMDAWRGRDAATIARAHTELVRRAGELREW